LTRWARFTTKEFAVIVTVSFRHMEVTPALKQFAETKAMKLTKYYDKIQEIEVVLDAGKAQIGVEIIVNAEHKDVFIATTTKATDMCASTRVW